MGLLSSIVAGAGSLLGGDAIKDIGNIVDDLHTSGEEKEEAKQKITQILAQAEQAAQAQVSARWEADLKHGSWLSKKYQTNYINIFNRCIRNTKCIRWKYG